MAMAVGAVLSTVIVAWAEPLVWLPALSTALAVSV